MSDKEICRLYKLIKKNHEKYLVRHGVKLPALKRKGKYTESALVLVYLSEGYPDTAVVSKGDLTKFVRKFVPEVNDLQQARHLGKQMGWYILSGTRNDAASIRIPRGHYKLQSLEEPYPGFNAKFRNGSVLSDDVWESIKRKYQYRCACCGSREGKKHRYNPELITKLQKGHMDPTKELTENNVIPQCQECNRPARNYWVFDDKGRVIRIADATAIDSCSSKVKKEMYKKLYQLYNGQNPNEP